MPVQRVRRVIHKVHTWTVLKVSLGFGGHLAAIVLMPG